MWVFGLTGPQNVTIDKKSLYVQAPKVKIHELFLQLSENDVIGFEICIISSLPSTSRRGGLGKAVAVLN